MDDVAGYELRFRRAGLPLFIEDYSAREDVFTRAIPFFGLVFVLELLGAISLDWPLAANIGAAFGGLVILLAGFGVLNRLRGRPLASLPRRVGYAELAVYVLLPALLPVVFGGQFGSAAGTAAFNLGTVALAYLVVGFGLFSIVRWTGGRIVGALAASFALLSRAIPLLMIFAVVLFLTVEMWEVFAAAPNGLLATVGLMFVVLGTAFLVARLPREVRRLERDAGAGPPLNPRQRVNVGLVMLVSQALQVLIVSVAVGAFFVAFGALLIGPEIRADWIGSAGHELLAFDLLGEQVSVTEELLRVAGAIAMFSGFYYAIAVLTDATYREEFLDELTGEMRDTFRARAEYLRVREATGGAPTA